jgi:hypothetical protein
MKLTTKIIKNLIREVLAEGRAVEFEGGKDVALTIADAIVYGDEIDEEVEDLRAAQAFAREHAKESIEEHQKVLGTALLLHEKSLEGLGSSWCYGGLFFLWQKGRKET